MSSLLLTLALLAPWVFGGVNAEQSWWYGRLPQVPTCSVAGGACYIACEERGSLGFDCVLVASGVSRTVTTVNSEVLEQRYPVYVPMMRQAAVQAP